MSVTDDTTTRTRATGGSAAVRRPGAARGKRRPVYGQENRAGYTFLLPWMLGFIGLTAGPMLASLYLSFTEYNLFQPPQWVGWDNYVYMFQDPRFFQSAQVTLIYVVLGTPI